MLRCISLGTESYARLNTTTWAVYTLTENLEITQMASFVDTG